MSEQNNIATEPAVSNPPKPEPKFEVKLVRHNYTPEERVKLSDDLVRLYGKARGIKSEFDQVKASFKSRKAEVEAKIEKISTDITNRWDMRNKRCRVEYQPKIRKKFFYAEDAPPGADPDCVEDMTKEDFQADLIQAESKFEVREEITLFPQAGSDRGVLVVGRLNGRWFSALRISVGGRQITERLDSEQKSVKERADAVKTAGKRALQWLTDNLGTKASKGFEASIGETIQNHKERSE